jgi:hypothetical protein
MKRIASGLTACLLLGWVQPLLADPAWTRDGNCAACHTVPYDNVLSVFGHDGTASPGGRGELKVFRAPRSQIKSLYVGVGGLTSGDQYAFGLKGFRYGGITSGATLTYSADCDWANWGGPPGVYSYNDFSLRWGVDPSSVPYDISIGSAAIYDYYDLTFMLAGRSSTGDLFYAEERVYLQIRPPNTPPLVAISSPTEGGVLRPAPMDITISANASDPGGDVSKVEFFVNGNKIGEDPAAPYSVIWSQVAKGSYSLTAKATDSDGASTTSIAVSITVEGVPADFDNDSDVDQTDFGHVQLCMSGAAAPGSGCGDADLNSDNLVNGLDVSLFAGCLSGAGVQGDPTCLN